MINGTRLVKGNFVKVNSKSLPKPDYRFISLKTEVASFEVQNGGSSNRVNPRYTLIERRKL
ncbi:MAG: hypothetical protein QXL27_04935 [Candidatus Bathyarchaeia archaeon]